MHDSVNDARNEAPPEIASSLSLSKYTLRMTGAPSLGQLVAVAVATALYTVLSWLSIIPFPSPVIGVSALFLAIGFGIPFALWFGGWAFIIAYIGNFLGGALLPGTVPVLVAIPFALADIIQLGLPMILYRLFASRFGVSPIGKDVFTPRGFLFFVLCAVLPGNILGGLYGNLVLVLGNVAPPDSLLVGWFSWSLANIVVTLIIGPFLLATLGPVIERAGLTIRNALS